MAIGIGGCVFMSFLPDNASNKWVGAVLFSIGLCTVFTYGLDLYTGKNGYIVEADDKPRYLVYLLVIIVGNFVGTLIMGTLMPMSDAQAQILVDGRLDDIDWWRVFCKGVGCGILMFIAADFYKTRKRYLLTFLCVPIFILSGMEHSIADMFYFASAGEYSVDAFLFIVDVALGNIVGGMIIPECRKYMYEDRPAAPAGPSQ